MTRISCEKGSTKLLALTYYLCPGCRLDIPVVHSLECGLPAEETLTLECPYCDEELELEIRVNKKAH